MKKAPLILFVSLTVINWAIAYGQAPVVANNQIRINLPDELADRQCAI